MHFRTTWLTVLALCGAGVMNGQGASILHTSIDPQALQATEVVLNFKFGPGTTPGTDCMGTTNTGYCFATANFSIPAGKRMVIQNISAAVSFDANNGPDVPANAIMMLADVGGTVGSSFFPFDTIQQVGDTTHYYLNKNVHVYADSSGNFPELEISNLTGLGPIFSTGTGSATITLSGYLVNLR